MDPLELNEILQQISINQRPDKSTSVSLSKLRGAGFYWPKTTVVFMDAFDTIWRQVTGFKTTTENLASYVKYNKLTQTK